MEPAHSDSSIDRGQQLPPPLEEAELCLLEALVYPTKRQRCPCRCGKHSAHILHLIALRSRERPDGSATRTPSRATWRTFNDERDPENGKHPTRPLVEQYDGLPDVGNYRAMSEVGSELALSYALRGDIPNRPQALWSVSKESCREVIALVGALSRRGYVVRRSCEAGPEAEFQPDPGRSYLDCIVRATKSGKEALEAKREGPGVEAAPEEPPPEVDVLDVNDANGLVLGSSRSPVSYRRGKKNEHQMTFEYDSESKCVANALVEWVRLKERPSWASPKIVSYIRDAFGREAIEGRGKHARLTVPLRLSPRLRQHAKKLAAYRHTGQRFPPRSRE